MADQQRWTIKREVSLGDLIAFVAAFCSVIYAYSTLDKRVTIIEREYVLSLKNAQRQDEDMAQLKRDIKDDLQRINDKLDKLVYPRADRR